MLVPAEIARWGEGFGQKWDGSALLMTSPEAPNLGAPAVDEDAELLAEFLTIDAQIRHFLAGNTAGRGLLEALYNHVLDEEIPDRLTHALQKR